MKLYYFKYNIDLWLINVFMYSNISKRLKDVLDNFNVFWEEGILFLTILYNNKNNKNYIKP